MDPQTFRRLLGRFATGVTVVTTNVERALHGMTANAVSSVSLDPPLVLVCVDRSTHCHRQLHATQHFGLNVLGRDQEEISNLFARAQEPEIDALRGATYRLGLHDVPLLEGAIATLVCRRHATHPGGDHDIFVGELIDGAAGDGRDPLLYFGGGYRGLRR